MSPLNPPPLRRLRVLGVAILLLSPSALGRASAEENALANPGFEKGGSSLAGWQSVYPRGTATPAPTFRAATEAPHGGERCGSIVVRYQGGYTSLSQTIRVDDDARSLRFEAWARIDEVGRGRASLAIWFEIPGHPQGGTLVESPWRSEGDDWRRLRLDAAVPEGTRSLIARCGVFGPCCASFDDAALRFSDAEVVVGKLAVAHGDYLAHATARAPRGSLRVSIPFPLGGQTPLAVRVHSEPEGKVAGLRIGEDRENRPLEIRLAPMDRGDRVELRVETLCLLRDRELPDGRGVALRGRGRPPKEVRLHLESAAGIDAEAASIQRLARDYSDRDLASLMEDLAASLREKLVYAGGGSQGATECLESGQAVCTGYANTAAALLIARKVPTRVLACTTLGSRLQEHYLIEAWTPRLGWSRMESTAAMFPWGDSQNLVLRIVYPDASRSTADVPLYKEGGGKVDCHFRMGADQCWQGSAQLSQLALSPDSLEALESAARERFDDLMKKTATGNTARFVGGEKIDKKEGTEELLLAVQEWLGEEG